MSELDLEILGAKGRLKRVEVLFPLGPECTGRDAVANTLAFASGECSVLVDLHAPDHAVTLNALVLLVLVRRLVLLAVMAVLRARVNLAIIRVKRHVAVTKVLDPEATGVERGWRTANRSEGRGGCHNLVNNID
jgi:hypothetical protein